MVHCSFDLGARIVTEFEIVFHPKSSDPTPSSPLESSESKTSESLRNSVHNPSIVSDRGNGRSWSRYIRLPIRTVACLGVASYGSGRNSTSEIDDVGDSVFKSKRNMNGVLSHADYVSLGAV